MPTRPVYHICPKNIMPIFTLIQLIMRNELDFCRLNIADISPSSSFISFISLRALVHFSHSSKMCGYFLNEISRAYLPGNGKIKLNKKKPELLGIVKEGFLCTTFICYSWKVEKWQSKSIASLRFLGCS